MVNGHDDLIDATLLKINSGIDTGPVYGYYKYGGDPHKESHMIIQDKVVTENMDQIQCDLIAIYNDQLQEANVNPSFSKVWGQPWLSKYLSWKIKEWLNKKNSKH